MSVGEKKGPKKITDTPVTAPFNCPKNGLCTVC